MLEWTDCDALTDMFWNRYFPEKTSKGLNERSFGVRSADWSNNEEFAAGNGLIIFDKLEEGRLEYVSYFELDLGISVFGGSSFVNIGVKKTLTMLQKISSLRTARIATLVAGQIMIILFNKNALIRQSPEASLRCSGEEFRAVSLFELGRKTLNIFSFLKFLLNFIVVHIWLRVRNSCVPLIILRLV